MKKLFTLILLLCSWSLQYSGMAQTEKIVTTTIPFQVHCTSSAEYETGTGTIKNYQCKNGSSVCYKSDKTTMAPTSCEFIKSTSAACLGRAWSAAYGMPTVDAYGNLKMASSPGQVFNIGSQPFCKGQGIFTSFSFKKGYKYEIILTTMNTGFMTFTLQASNGGTANNSGACGSIQNPQGYMPTTDMQFFNKALTSFTYTMIADKDFSKFWIHSDHTDKVFAGTPYTDDCSLISVEIKETPPILGNKVCCDQTIPSTILDWPYTANPVDQDAGTTITTFTGNQISYRWEVYNPAQGNWNAVTAETFNSSYSPINMHSAVKLRRIAYVDVPLSTGPYHWNTAPSNVITIAPQPIVDNRICCPLTAYIKSNTPTGTLTSDDDYTMTGVIGSPIYQWQYSYDQNTWVDIPNTNFANYTPKYLLRATWFRRVISTKMQPDGYPSNPVLIDVQSCMQPSIDQGNTICGDQYYYKQPISGSITPIKIYGSRWKPDGYGTFDYEWQVSYDKGATWGVLNEKNKWMNDEDRLWDITPPTINFTNFWFGYREVWYKRIEWRAYDSWDCGLLHIDPCGNEWHEKSHSNIVKIIYTTLPDPNVLEITGKSNINGRSISCGITSFTLGFVYNDDIYNILNKVEWSVVDNIDWKVSPGGGIWGVDVLPWVTNTTGLTHATIRARLFTYDGRIIDKDFVVTAPPIPVVTLNKTGPLNICKGVGTSVKGTGSGGTGTLTLTHTSTLDGLTTSTSGNEYTVSVPAAQTNYSPQLLTITVTDANGCSSSKAITINPDGEGWIHDQPWIAGATHYPAIGDNTGNGNTYANIVAEERGNIYYVGLYGNLTPVYNTILTYQWDAANLQWRNFPFPKYDNTVPGSNPTVIDAAGPLAISDDPVTHLRKIYYVTTDGKLNYIQSKGGYVDEFNYVDATGANGSTNNWISSPINFSAVTDAGGSLSPLNYGDGRVIYKSLGGSLNIVGPSETSFPTTLVSSVKGHNFIVTATNKLIYVDGNNNIKVLDISNSFVDITPVGLNGVYAGTNSSLVYSDAKQYLYFVAGRTNSDNHFGKIGLYDFSTNQLHYTDDITNAAAPAFFKAPSLTINKATGVCYAGGASTSPDGATDYEVYQCFVDNGQLLVRRLNSKDSPSLSDGYGGISVVSERKLYTDYNLFFVSDNSDKIHMDYYFSGGCGPGITKMAFDPDHVYAPESKKEESVTTEGSIVPNPTKGDFQVYYNQQKEAEIEILVYSALGELVNQSNQGIVPAGNNVFAVENTNFTSGLYFVKVIENGKLKFTGKMMVQK